MVIIVINNFFAIVFLKWILFISTSEVKRKGKTMKKFLLCNVLLISLVPLNSNAGGIEDIPPALPVIDTPAMRPGFGYWIEANYLRGYTNQNDAYGNSTVEYSSSTVDVVDYIDYYRSIDQNYSFGLQVGGFYVIPDTANVLKLSYGHLFAHTTHTNFTGPRYDLVNEVGNVVIRNTKASRQQKLDDVTLLSEQHVLIGPYWETTISGGARYARVSQDSGFYSNSPVFSIPEYMLEYHNYGKVDYALQFNGVGPMLGLGGLFHFWENCAFGAEVQGALLMGREKINYSQTSGQIYPTSLTLTIEKDIDDQINSMVPEFFYRIYANYFARLNNGAEIELELGWRTNQFFNLRIWQFGAYSGEDAAVAAVNTTYSQDIGFSGPYLTFQYKL
jgi:hypothetical protein